MVKKTYSLDFTDGDTFKRFTIFDSDIGPTDYPFCAIDKRSTEDADDSGWVYVTNVAKVRGGQFDVIVAAHAWDRPAMAGEYPNEVISLVYLLQQ